MLTGISIAHLMIIVIIVAGICAIGLIVLKTLKIQIPEWFVQILWVCLAVVVGVVAIKFVASLI